MSCLGVPYDLSNCTSGEQNRLGLTSSTFNPERRSSWGQLVPAAHHPAANSASTSTSPLEVDVTDCPPVSTPDHGSACSAFPDQSPPWSNAEHHRFFCCKVPHSCELQPQSFPRRCRWQHRRRNTEQSRQQPSQPSHHTMEWSRRCYITHHRPAILTGQSLPDAVAFGRTRHRARLSGSWPRAG